MIRTQSAGIIEKLIFDTEQERDEYVAELNKGESGEDYIILSEGKTKKVEEDESAWRLFLLVMRRYNGHELCHDIDVSG